MPVLITGFLPIPFKIITIAFGACAWMTGQVVWLVIGGFIAI